MDKLCNNMFNEWKSEIRADEDRQQQTLNCGGLREPYKGYPQSLAEAVNRTKMVEKQVKQKRTRSKNQNEKEINLKRERPQSELSNFALVKEQNTKPRTTNLTDSRTTRLSSSEKQPRQAITDSKIVDTVKS